LHNKSRDLEELENSETSIFKKTIKRGFFSCSTFWPYCSSSFLTARPAPHSVWQTCRLIIQGLCFFVDQLQTYVLNFSQRKPNYPSKMLEGPRGSEQTFICACGCRARLEQPSF
jgi:hypothetical protein